MQVKKALKFFLLVFLLLTLLMSCRNAGSSANEQVKIAYYAFNSEPILDWDPAVMFSNGIVVLQNIYETLLRYDPVKGQSMPLLAESYTKSDDSLKWTFRIRKGVKFHDQTEMNAQAVKHSIDRTVRINKGAAYIWMALDRIEVEDNYTVTFHLTYPVPLDLIVATGYAAYIYSPAQNPGDDSAWFNEGNACGTGPYQLERQAAGDHVLLAKFDDYWQGWQENNFDKVMLQKVSETSSRRQLIEKGEADVTYNLPYEDILALKKNNKVSIIEEKSFINIAAYFNTQKAPLNQPLVRQALSYAFPYQDVVQYVMGGYASQSRGPIPQGLWGHGEELFQYSHDLDKAKELLARAGYPGGGFQLLYTYNSGDENEKTAAELYKVELSKIGVDLEIRGMPWDSQWELAKGARESRQHILVMYWWPDYASPISWLWNLYHSEESPLFNLSYYQNAKVDRLIEEADTVTASDKKKAASLFLEAQKMIIEDAVAIFKYDKINTWAVSQSFKGFVPNPAYPNVVFFYDTYRE